MANYRSTQTESKSRAEIEFHPRNVFSSYQGNKVKVTHGLRWIEGQVRGIRRMVEKERYCVCRFATMP